MKINRGTKQTNLALCFCILIRTAIKATKNSTIDDARSHLKVFGKRKNKNKTKTKAEVFVSVAGDADVQPDCPQSPAAGLRDGPVGSLGRRRGHQLRVRVCRAFLVRGWDCRGDAVNVLQEDGLGDRLLDAFPHSWAGQKHTGKTLPGQNNDVYHVMIKKPAVTTYYALFCYVIRWCLTQQNLIWIRKV